MNNKTLSALTVCVGLAAASHGYGSSDLEKLPTQAPDATPIVTSSAATTAITSMVAAPVAPAQPSLLATELEYACSSSGTLSPAASTPKSVPFDANPFLTDSVTSTEDDPDSTTLRLRSGITIEVTPEHPAAAAEPVAAVAKPKKPPIITIPQHPDNE